MRENPFEIIPYSIENLLCLFSKASEASEKEIRSKLNARYFRKYFERLEARTIVVEHDYFDHDYLEDYAAYYARCFHGYRRKCVRLHFFEQSFTEDGFRALLKGEVNSQLLGSYLGFIVVRPLPMTIIGRTCLKTYPHDGCRYFYATREYAANLYGLNLKVDSLAFQEQDQAVSACATSALWSAFQKTGYLFQHSIPSPVEITRSANERFPVSSRVFPSSGLRVEQMAGSIRSVGLEPYLVEVEHGIEVLRPLIYGYLRSGIPLLLLISLYSTDGTTPRFIGRHAVAVNGFSMGKSRDKGLSAQFVSSRMDKIYVHDDQVGPFARMELDREDISTLNGKFSSICSAWGDTTRAVPEFLLVPLYHKIRIPFETVYKVAAPFVAAVSRAFCSVVPILAESVEWDLHLTSVNDFRSDLLTSGSLLSEHVESTLCESYPRFLWRLKLLIKGTLKIDFVFDATDIQQGRFLLKVIEYDHTIAGYLRSIVENPVIRDHLMAIGARQILEWYHEHS